MSRWAEFFPGSVLLGKASGPTSRVGANDAGDQLDSVLDYLIIPGGTFRENSHVILWEAWEYPLNTGLTKTLIPRFGAGGGVPAAGAGSSLGQAAPTAGVSSNFGNMFWNGGSLTQQYGVNNTNPWASVGASNGKLSFNIDTTQDTFISFSMRWSAPTTETITLLNWFALLLP